MWLFGFDLNSCKSKATTTTDLISIGGCFSIIIKKENKEISSSHETIIKDYSKGNLFKYSRNKCGKFM